MAFNSWARSASGEERVLHGTGVLSGIDEVRSLDPSHPTQAQGGSAKSADEMEENAAYRRRVNVQGQLHDPTLGTGVLPGQRPGLAQHLLGYPNASGLAHSLYSPPHVLGQETDMAVHPPWLPPILVLATQEVVHRHAECLLQEAGRRGKNGAFASDAGIFLPLHVKPTGRPRSVRSPKT